MLSDTEKYYHVKAERPNAAEKVNFYLYKILKTTAIKSW